VLKQLHFILGGYVGEDSDRIIALN